MIVFTGTVIIVNSNCILLMVGVFQCALRCERCSAAEYSVGNVWHSLVICAIYLIVDFHCAMSLFYVTVPCHCGLPLCYVTVLGLSSHYCVSGALYP